MTGTPEGVGAVKAGDVIEAGLGELTKIKFAVADKHADAGDAKKKAVN